MNKLTDWPAPGVYANIPFTQYVTLNAVNATLLKFLHLYAPKKAHARFTDGKFTPAMKEGQALHVFMLEPKRFSKEYAIALPCQAKLKSGAREGEFCGADTAEMTAEGWRCGKHRSGAVYNITSITQELHVRLVKAREEIWRTVPDLMRSVEARKTETELTLLWIDPETELPCKARMDYFTPADTVITDLKKCRSAVPTIFGGDVGLHAYHVQDAWYRRAAAACFGPGDYVFQFLATELNKDEVNGVQLLGLGEEEQAAGDSAAHTALQIFAAMSRAKAWTDNSPVYSQEKKIVKMRPYMIRAEDA